MKILKLIISVVFLTIAQHGYAGINGMTAIGKSMTFLRVEIHHPNEYPKTVAVGFPIDSVLELHDESLVGDKEFLERIFECTDYISLSSITFESSIYSQFFGANRDVFLAGEKFCQDFDKHLQEKGQHMQFMLKDGTHINISYMNIYGFFIYGNKHDIYPMGETSLSIDYMDFNTISDVWFIMSVICYQKSEIPPISLN